ncbi:MAG: helix-turn-helix domain-containing protein [Parcubacteria group bacterium]|nr:helix-turn-helix domain-containing protein [Parcubacteria group bacterium]
MEDSFSVILRARREEFKRSLPQEALETKIPLRFLTALEEGQFDELPAEVYTVGLLRRYAHHLNLNPEGIVRLYRQEYQRARPVTNELVPPQPLARVPIVITPRLIAITALTLFFVGVIGYVGFQIYTFVRTPYLTVYEPASNLEVTDDVILVAGATDSDAELSIDGHPVVVSEAGTFQEEIELLPGTNTISLRVVNRFGRALGKTIVVFLRTK